MDSLRELRERAERFLDEVGDGDLAEDMAIFARAVVRDHERELHDRVLLTEHERDSETTRAEAAEQKLRERDAEITRLREGKENAAKFFDVALGKHRAEIARLKGELERISVRSDELESFYDEHTLEIARLKRRVEAGADLAESVRYLVETGEPASFLNVRFKHSKDDALKCLRAWDAAKDPGEGE